MKKILVMTIVVLMSLSLFIGCAPTQNEAAESTEHVVTSEENPVEPGELEQITGEAAISGQDAFLPKIVVYNGTSYFMTDNDSSKITQEMLGDKIGESSVYLDFSQQIDEETLTLEFANSFASDAVFYNLKDYSDKLRIVAYADDTYYICESTTVEASEILHLKELVTGGTVSSGSGLIELSQVNKDDAAKLVDIFANTQKAVLDDNLYEDLSQAHVDGKTYMLNLNLQDGTFISFYLVPEKNLVNIGQTYYTSDTLNSDIESVFGELPQTPDGIVN